MGKKEYAKEIGKLICKYRKKNELSQEDLAWFLLTDRNVISRYERGTVVLSAITLMQIAKILDEPINSFVPQELKCKNTQEKQIKEILKNAETQMLELL